MYDKTSLRLALTGAHAVFLVTDFWATISREQEELQGKSVADVAKVKSKDPAVHQNKTHILNRSLTLST